MEFDKKFVHCIWDDSLVGKLCVFADDIPDLKQHVERSDPHYIAVLQAPDYDTDMDALAYPFYKDANANTGYRFVYYDHNLECKLAHEQGKQIQFWSNKDCEWVDVEDPMWSDTDEYRVKPDEPASDAERKYVPYDSVSEMIYDHFNVDCVEDIKNCIWLRSKSDTNMRLMITGIDIDEVMVNNIWQNPSQLLDDYLWDDYTVIGK